MQSFGDRFAERHADPHTEAATDEGKAQFLTMLFGDLHAEAAGNALAGFVDDLRVRIFPGKFAPLPFEMRGVGVILDGVLAQLTPLERTAITVQAAFPLAHGFFMGEAFILCCDARIWFETGER